MFVSVYITKEKHKIEITEKIKKRFKTETHTKLNNSIMHAHELTYLLLPK